MIIDEGVFEPENDLEGWNERLKVYCDDPQAAARALVSAGLRLQRVTWSGRELSEEEAEVWDDHDDAQVCEYVSEPAVQEDGASVYMDTMSELSIAAAATFFSIISEELMAEGIESARLAEDDS